MTKKFILGAAFAVMLVSLSSCSSCSKHSSMGYSRLEPSIRPTRYEISLDPKVEAGDVTGHETIDLVLERPTREIVLHSDGLTIDEATADGVSASIKADPSTESVRFKFERDLAGPTTKLSVRWHGKLRDDSEGFYHTKDRGRWYALTQFEPTYARRMFPCFDEPALKAVFKLSVVVDAGMPAVSNAPIARRTPAGPGRELVEFEDSPKQSTYLNALAVGPFTRITDGFISVYMPAGRDGLGAAALKDAQDSIKFFNSYFGIRYPFKKLDMIACPQFSAGGMENTAAIFYAEAAFLLDSKKASKAQRRNLFGLVSHEIAHQWFGDLVTMKWWDDLWLNEAFATFMASKATAAVHPEFEEDEEIAGRLTAPMSKDSYPSTHPVHSAVSSPGEAESQFDAITYIKGSAALRMLETYVGAEAYRKGIHDYLKDHSFSNATGDDLWDAISSHAPAGRDAKVFARRWFDAPGVPVVGIELTCESGAPALKTSQERFFYDDGEASRGQSAARWPIPLCFTTSAKGPEVCAPLDKPVDSIRVGDSCPKWLYPNAGAKGYFRTRLSSDLRRAVLGGLKNLRTVDRIAFWDLDSMAEFNRGWLHASDMFDVLDTARTEKSWRLWRSYAGFLDFVDWALVKPADRRGFEEYVGKLATPLFERLLHAKSKSVDDRTLEAAVFGVLGDRTDGTSVRDRARRWLAEYEQAPRKFDPELTDAVLRVAARFGDAKLWEAFKTRGLAQADPRDRMRYIMSLGFFRDPALIQKTLELSLDVETLHDQERLSLIRALAANLSARATAARWARTHWDDYSRTLPHSFMRSAVMPLAGVACTRADLDEVTSFFASSSHRPEGYERDVETIIAGSRRCVAIAERETALVSSKFAQK